jgi:hypothetical protein
MKPPFIARPAALVLTFVSEVVVLHLLVVAIPPIGPKKVGWAIVQYGVIVLAVVGLLRQG